jgi:hypothetical protein
MTTANRLFVAALVGLSVGALASQASAQNMSKRDAAITGCVAQAQAQYPSTGSGDNAQSRNRTALYKACMTSKGLRP